jgi:hypothetical protein
MYHPLVDNLSESDCNRRARLDTIKRALCGSVIEPAKRVPAVILWILEKAGYSILCENHVAFHFH